ncbi:hypothetical protein AKJ16_DCAP15929, partial [Drosera capensis]
MRNRRSSSSQVNNLTANAKLNPNPKSKAMMDPLIWHKVAPSPVWQTASLYHLTHTAALLAAPLTKNPTIFGGLLTTGILAFSGTSLNQTLTTENKSGVPHRALRAPGLDQRLILAGQRIKSRFGSGFPQAE